MKIEKVAILFNPSAGGGKAIKKKAILERLLYEYKIPHDLFVTKSEDNLKELTRDNLKKYRNLIGAGGDSTFNIMINEIVKEGADINFGLIGVGSSNDIAKEFGADTLEKACLNLKKMRIKRIDLGCITLGQTPLRYFLGQANIGLGVFVNMYVAQMAAQKSRLSKHQTLSGVLGIVDSYRSKKIPLPLIVEYDKDRVEGEFTLAVFSNIRYWATGRIVCPDALPNDCQLDGCLIKKCSFSRLIRIIVWAHKGRHRKLNEVKILQAPSFEVSSEKSFGIQTDGEILSGNEAPSQFNKIKLHIIPKALNLIC